MASDSPIRSFWGDRRAAEEQRAEEGPVQKGKKMGHRRLLMVLLGIPVQAVLAYLAIVYLVLPGIETSGIRKWFSSEKKDRTPIGVIYTLKDIVVNPAETRGTRYLNVTVGLEVTDSKEANRLKEREVELRDLLIDILASKRLDELDGVDDRERLREEITNKVGRLTNGQLIRVFFSNFVLQ